MKPIMHIATEKMLFSVVKNMPQSMLLYGKSGVGLMAVAQYIADLLKITPTIVLPEKNEVIDLENGVIGVKIIRNIYDETRTKTSKARLIIIDYAERMTNQSQNAFLKLLEEPGEGVHFLLVSHSIDVLLPTILSRTEKLEVKPISTKQTEQMIENLGITDPKKRSQLQFMALGLPAEITKLAINDEYFDKRSSIIRDARDSLTGSLYNKLLIAQKYKDNRPDALLLIDSILSILSQSVNNKPQINTIARIDSVLSAYKQIESNGNIRLCLTRMFV